MMQFYAALVRASDEKLGRSLSETMLEITGHSWTRAGVAAWVMGGFEYMALNVQAVMRESGSTVYRVDMVWDEDHPDFEMKVPTQGHPRRVVEDLVEGLVEMGAECLSVGVPWQHEEPDPG